jgi:hypothetical protein
MPAGEVGAGDVADLALVYKAVQSIESFFDRRQGVEAVEVVNVHIIGVEAAQAGFERHAEMVAGGAEVIGPPPIGNVALVEMRALSRLPSRALPRISSDRPRE